MTLVDEQFTYFEKFHPITDTYICVTIAAYQLNTKQEQMFSIIYI